MIRDEPNAFPPAVADTQASRPAVYNSLGDPFGSFAFSRHVSRFPDQVGRYFEVQLQHFEKSVLGDILRQNLKTQSTKESKLARYALTPLYPSGEYHRGVPVQGWHYHDVGNKSYSLYLDATTAFALTHKNVPQIIFGFERTGVSICTFEQIQLVHPYVKNENGEIRRPGPDGLYRFNIDSLKLQLTEEWSMFNACPNLTVVHSSSNRAAVDESSILTAAEAENMYDAAFDSAGYQIKLFHGKKYWVENLSRKIESRYTRPT